MHHIVSLARTIAFEAAADQLYGTFPYREHLEDAYQILREFTLPHGIHDAEVEAATYLHDTPEDHGDTWPLERLAAYGMSARVLDLVWRVTDEPGKNRAERKAKTYPKIAGKPESVVIKLVDRLANVRRGRRDQVEKKLAMYRSEQPHFRQALDLPGHRHDQTWGPVIKDLWQALDQELGIQPHQRP